MELGESACVPETADPIKVHAILMLKSVTFSANHPVEKDTTGNFAAPEWLRGRTSQWPVCYTRGKSINITATFDVLLGPTSGEDVAIRARMDLGGGAALEWNGSVHVGVDETEVTTSEMPSSGPLPNQVACFDPAGIEFFASPPGEPFGSAGTSSNGLYVVLGDPSGTPPFWTLLDISCGAAAGATTPQAVVERSFVPFTSRSLTRKRDGQGLTYWNPDTTTATNTQELLASGDGSGQCGSWSEFLIDMYKVHGITSAAKVLIVRTVAEWQAASAGFLVKNWEFIGAGSHPLPFTHELGRECVKRPGIPGQRSPDPPPAFFNHFIVLAFGKFYDPSYGGGPIANQTDWENGAIDGLFSRGYGGFPKRAHPTTLLVELYNLTTNMRL